MQGTFIKKRLQHRCSCKHCEIFKSTYFEQHLRAAASFAVRVFCHRFIPTANEQLSNKEFLKLWRAATLVMSKYSSFFWNKGIRKRKCPFSVKLILVGCLLQKAAANHEFQPTATCSKSSKETPEKLLVEGRGEKLVGGVFAHPPSWIGLGYFNFWPDFLSRRKIRKI